MTRVIDGDAEDVAAPETQQPGTQQLGTRTPTEVGETLP
jgi:hypothetical protein